MTVRQYVFYRGAGRIRTPHTGFSTDMVGPRKLEMVIEDQSLWNRVISRVRTRDKTFNRRFAIHCAHPEAARVWLHRRTLSRLLKVTGYRFLLRDGRAVAERVGIEDDERAIALVKRAVTSLADGTRALVKQWRKVVASLDNGRVRKRRSGWPRIVGKHRGYNVEVRVRRVSTLIYIDDRVARTIDAIVDDDETLFAAIESAIADGSSTTGVYR